MFVVALMIAIATLVFCDCELQYQHDNTSSTKKISKQKPFYKIAKKNQTLDT